MELSKERFVMVEVALFTNIPPERVERPVVVRVDDKERVDKDWAPLTVMALGISESVRPDAPEIVTLDRDTEERESIFWVKVIILTLPSVLVDRDEMEERRSARVFCTSSLIL